MPTTTSTVAALVLTLGFATSVAAQTPATAKPPVHETGTALTPTYELSLGYQMVRTPDVTFPLGLSVDGARNFGPLGIAAEIGWVRHSDDDFDATTNLWHFAAGPRWSGRNASRIWPFAQVLAGAGHYRFGDDDFSDSTTKFILQPGAGVVIIGGDGWGIVGQADYRRVFLDEDEDGESGENDLRVFFGVRVILD